MFRPAGTQEPTPDIQATIEAAVEATVTASSPSATPAAAGTTTLDGTLPATPTPAFPVQAASTETPPASSTPIIVTSPGGPTQPGASPTPTNPLSLGETNGIILETVPVGGSGFGIAFDGEHLWMVHEGSAVTKMTTDGRILGRFPAGPQQLGVVFDGTNIWVSNKSANTVTKLAKDGTQLGTFTVGTGPRGLAFDGTAIWVANDSSNNVTKLALEGTVQGTFQVGSHPVGVAVYKGSVWVTNNLDGTVTQLGLNGTLQRTISVGNSPFGLAFGGDAVWVTHAGAADNTVTKFSIDGTILGTFVVGPQPVGIATDGTSIWVANWGGTTLTRLGFDGTELRTLEVGPGPYSVLFDGEHLRVTKDGDDTITKLAVQAGPPPSDAPSTGPPNSRPTSVAYWPFDDSQGNTVADGSDNGHLGTLHGGASWTEGKAGGAIALDGVDGYISVPDGEGLDGITQLTIDVRVLLRSYPGSVAAIVSKWGPAGPPDDSYSLDVASDGTLRLVVSDGQSTGSTMTVRTSVNVVPLGAWKRLTATWKAPGEIHLYIDGVDVSGEYPQGYGHSTAIIGDNQQDLWIGRSRNVPGGGQSFLNAAIDELRIYDKVLEPTSPKSPPQLTM